MAAGHLTGNKHFSTIGDLQFYANQEPVPRRRVVETWPWLRGRHRERARVLWRNQAELAEVVVTVTLLRSDVCAGHLMSAKHTSTITDQQSTIYNRRAKALGD